MLQKSNFVSALCVSSNSVYKTIPGVDCYDQERDARSASMEMPVICHPPCRGWSAYMRHFAKPPIGEKDLAYLCAERVATTGGVMEHPAHSRFYTEVLGMVAGEEKGVFKLVEVSQSWFGYPTRKRTWLLLPREWVLPPFPFSLTQYGKEREIFENMSHADRSRTTLEFAKFLIEAVVMNQAHGLGARGFLASPLHNSTEEAWKNVSVRAL